MRFIFLVLSFCSAVVVLRGQTDLSGTINVYGLLQAQSDCPPTVRVANAADFAPGMAVLIIQMGAATIDTDNSNRFGNLTDLNGSGRYEYNRIQSISGNELELEYSLLHTYTPQRTQVVGTPIYSSANVTATLRPQAWNGTTGGVVFLECTDNLSLRADIAASGTGYRGGGVAIYEDISCSVLTFNRAYRYESGNWRGAPKGEGVARLVSGAELGRGPQANGGGGGNNHNSGGGGGALFTAGGQGGENNEPSFGGCDGFFPGLGGKPLPFAPGRLYLGGGGGAGHTNNTADVAGGNGGGIIVLLTDELTFAGGRILADGQDGNSPTGDGAGGGGAGGTVLVRANRLNETPVVSARGGQGGDADNNNQARCFGPGGGGSGGLVMSNLNLGAELVGGAAGLSRNSQSCAEGTNDATSGQDGRQETLASLPQGAREGAPVNLLSLSSDTTLCPGELLVLRATFDNQDADFRWQRREGGAWVDLLDGESVSGAATPVLSLSTAPGRAADYRLRMLPVSDCYLPLTTEAITVSEFALPTAVPTFTRNGFTVNFSGNATATENYFWFFGAGDTSMEANPTYTFPEEGNYPVNLTITNDCGSETYTLEVRVNAPLEAAALATVRRGCVPLVVRFTDNSTGTVATRRWTFPGGVPATSTEANPLVTFPEVGTYQLSLRVSNEEMSDEVFFTVEVIAAPDGGFSWEAVENQVQFRNTSANAFAYRWDFGDGATSTEPNPIHTYQESGSYEVTLNASNGSCAVASTQRVAVIVNSVDAIDPASRISLYPNPSRGTVQLGGARESTVSLYSLRGQKLKRWTISTDSATLDLEALGPGIFLLVIEKEGRRQVRRLVNY